LIPHLNRIVMSDGSLTFLQRSWSPTPPTHRDLTLAFGLPHHHSPHPIPITTGPHLVQRSRTHPARGAASHRRLHQSHIGVVQVSWGSGPGWSIAKTGVPFPLTVLPIQPHWVLPPNRCYLLSFSAAIQSRTAKWAIEWSIPKTRVSFFRELVSFWELGILCDEKSSTEKWVRKRVCFP